MPLIRKGDKLLCEKHGEVRNPAWVNCWNGCDEGYFDGYEDDPLWYDEGDLIRCEECRGKGGWPVCPECNINNPDVEY